MGIFDNFKRNKESPKAVTKIQLLTQDQLNSFVPWDGNVYNNDLIRSIVRVKSRTVSKMTPKHIRYELTTGKTNVNPEPYVRLILEQPNKIMTMQQMLEKVMIQLELNNNAFIYIDRDDNGLPKALYPVISTSIQVFQTPANEYLLQFSLRNTNVVTFRYSDLIHLRQDYHDNELLGASNAEALRALLNVQSTIDQGIVAAIKNSNVVQWLLKYHQNLSPDDIKKSRDNFVKNFLQMDGSELAGAAAVDNKMDAQRIESKAIVPPTDMQNHIDNRVYSYFNINENIVQSKYTETEWIAFYESCIEPIAKQLTDTFTQAFFTRKERAYGNRIMFETSDLAFASLQTKLSMVAMVDRKALTPNEWREMFGKAPHSDGDEFLVRLDTVTVKEQNSSQGGDNVNENNQN